MSTHYLLALYLNALYRLTLLPSFTIQRFGYWGRGRSSNFPMVTLNRENQISIPVELSTKFCLLIHLSTIVLFVLSQPHLLQLNQWKKEKNPSWSCFLGVCRLFAETAFMLLLSIHSIPTTPFPQVQISLYVRSFLAYLFHKCLLFLLLYLCTCNSIWNFFFYSPPFNR